MQSINPWSWFIHSMGQLGLININLGRTPAPEIEERILDDVGSYGRQIGRISDALEVLVDRLELKDLDESQREAIILFKAQLAEVRRVKMLAYSISSSEREKIVSGA